MADFGQNKVASPHPHTFDCCFHMAKPGRSDGRLLSSVVEAMLGVFSVGVSRVIYPSTDVGIVFRSLIFETSIFLTSTSKII